MPDALTYMHERQRAMLWALLSTRALLRKARRAGTRPDFGRVNRLMAYVERFAEKRYQQNEERYLFEPLNARTPGLARTLRRLERDHLAMAGYGIRLRTTLGYWQQGDARAPALAMAVVDDYVRHCQRHVAAERSELMPLARATLTDREWAAAEQAFANVRDPVAPQASGAARAKALAELPA